MISCLVSRLIILTFGTLYPAYASFKVVQAKDASKYLKWMMYWIVFAIFTCIETITDLLLRWFPFYYEIKVILVIWLLSPATNGSSILYRQFVHPLLKRKEPEIDDCIERMREEGYATLRQFTRKSIYCARDVLIELVHQSFSKVFLLYDGLMHEKSAVEYRIADQHLNTEKEVPSGKGKTSGKEETIEQDQVFESLNLDLEPVIHHTECSVSKGQENGVRKEVEGKDRTVIDELRSVSGNARTKSKVVVVIGQEAANQMEKTPEKRTETVNGVTTKTSKVEIVLNNFNNNNNDTTDINYSHNNRDNNNNSQVGATGNNNGTTKNERKNIKEMEKIETETETSVTTTTTIKQTPHRTRLTRREFYARLYYTEIPYNNPTTTTGAGTLIASEQEKKHANDKNKTENNSNTSKNKITNINKNTNSNVETNTNAKTSVWGAITRFMKSTSLFDPRFQQP